MAYITYKPCIGVVLIRENQMTFLVAMQLDYDHCGCGERLVGLRGKSGFYSTNVATHLIGIVACHKYLHNWTCCHGTVSIDFTKINYCYVVGLHSAPTVEQIRCIQYLKKHVNNAWKRCKFYKSIWNFAHQFHHDVQHKKDCCFFNFRLRKVNLFSSWKFFWSQCKISTKRMVAREEQAMTVCHLLAHFSIHPQLLDK